MTDRHWRSDPAEAVHWDVAAYALGVLDPAEIERCEQHLAECPGCAAELEESLPVSALLADVDPNPLGQLEDPAMLERLTCAVRSDRRRHRRRSRLRAAVATMAAVVVTGAAGFAGATWLDLPPAPAGEPPTVAGGSPVPSTPPTGIGGADLDEGQQFSATDPQTGVHADVVLAERDWGTRIWFALSSVSGPLECRLVLVHADGTAEMAGSWRVPEEGYGNQSRPDPLLLEAAVSAPRSSLSELKVTSTAPDGTTGTLVTVAL